MPLASMAVHEPKDLSTMTGSWLLPIVSTIVASGSGSVVAGVLPNSQHQLITLITSYVLWGMGESLAMVVLVIYFLRLTTFRLPAKEVIVSTFLPLGPLGQGGFAIQQLGSVAREIFSQTHTLPASMTYAGDILYVAGFLIALIMWGFGLVWFFFALATIWRTPKFPFNMGWWGFTFPLGVYAVSTTTLAEEIPSAFFRILGTVFSVAVALLWVIVSCGTLWKAWTGEIFFAPCLKDVEGRDGAHSHGLHLWRKENSGNGDGEGIKQN